MKNHRKPVKKFKDKRVFTGTADKTHYKNLMATPMRGGFRI